MRETPYLILSLMILSGCQGQKAERIWNTGADVGPKATQGPQETTQTAGGNILSFAPTIAFSGGLGGLVMALAVMVVIRNRALKAVIRGVEYYRPGDGNYVKKQIASQAASIGIGKWLDRRKERVVNKMSGR